MREMASDADRRGAAFFALLRQICKGAQVLHRNVDMLARLWVHPRRSLGSRWKATTRRQVSMSMVAARPCGAFRMLRGSRMTGRAFAPRGGGRSGRPPWPWEKDRFCPMPSLRINLDIKYAPPLLRKFAVATRQRQASQHRTPRGPVPTM